MAEKQLVTAEARYVRISSSKVRRYLNLIKGKKFSEAVAILKFMPSPTAEVIGKVLESAGANAEENHNLLRDYLKVEDAVADQGPTLKRWRARAMGRGVRIRKRTSHITIVLTEVKS
ncbi:MAG TPA: 50S ribosomal protein L22 [bacterium]|nr:50S ribosomal protein L22 [bacterium]